MKQKTIIWNLKWNFNKLNLKVILVFKPTLCEKCPNTEFFGSYFSAFGPHSPCLVLMRKNADQKKLRIWTLFTQCYYNEFINEIFWGSLCLCYFSALRLKVRNYWRIVRDIRITVINSIFNHGYIISMLQSTVDPLLTDNVPNHVRTANWFALQINCLVSIW